MASSGSESRRLRDRAAVMVGLVVVFGAIVAPPANASSAASARADFNGDGFADLAVGVPFEVVGGAVDAGAVNVIYGSADGLSATAARPDQFWTQNSSNVDDVAEAGDNFGQALAAGDFNGDGFIDLAVGAPFEDVGAVLNAGAVNVIYGSANGLSATAARPDQLWTQNGPSVDDAAEAGDLFGSSLAAANFGNGSAADLAIGSRAEDVGGVLGAGGVNVIYGSASGLSATAAGPDQFWSQNAPNVNDSAESNDQFGDSLAAANFGAGSQADLAIGVPHETVGGVQLAGAVSVIYGSANGLSATAARPDQFWTQNSANVNDGADLADAFGESLAAANFGAGSQADLAVGVPGENVGGASTAGAVSVIYGSANGLSATAAAPDQFWSQDTANVEDTAEQGDSFGESLVAANFGNGSANDLAVGAPFEDFGGFTSTGAVNVIYGSANGLSATAAPDQFWTQDSPDVDDTAEAGDSFGIALAAADFGAGSQAELAIGARSEDVGAAASAGAVNVLYGSANGLSATASRADQFWTQNSANVNDTAEQGDQLGSSLAALR